MPRTFAYARVSTHEQTTENQIREIIAAGFVVEPHRFITETVSGSVPMAQRKGFGKLLDKMEPGDILVVSKLDRLGRDAIDVSSTVAHLEGMGIKVHCLALGGVDLASSAGRMTMNVINAVAQFERDLLKERTTAGIRRAQAAGKTLGRPRRISSANREAIAQALRDGVSVSSLARQYGVSRQTIMRERDEGEK